MKRSDKKVGAALPRGTIKSFRKYLNETFSTGPKHQHFAYQQRTRAYGDYLYHQDRAKFEAELFDAMAGNNHKNWSRP